jgi:hypothetical protein
MALKVESLEDGEDKLNALFYGDPGTGKSSDLAAMARLATPESPILIVDCESGIKRRPLRNLGIPVDCIKVVKVSEYKDVDSLLTNIEQKLDADPNYISGLGIDSFTDLQKKLLDAVVRDRISKRSSTMVVDPFDIDIKDHGKVTEMCRRIARRARDLPVHVGFVCLSKRELDPKTGEVVYRPDLTPKFAADLIGVCDIVVHTRMTGDNPDDAISYVGLTRPIDGYRGKDRFGATPTYLADPSFDRLVKYVHDENYKSYDPTQQRYESSKLAEIDGAVPANTADLDMSELG